MIQNLQKERYSATEASLVLPARIEGKRYHSGITRKEGPCSCQISDTKYHSGILGKETVAR